MVTVEICAIPRNACKSLTTSYAQQKFAQPMPRTQLILLGCLTCPRHIPERLESGARYPCCCQTPDLWLRASLKALRRLVLTRVARLDRSQLWCNNINEYYRLHR
jgi:hypothetical protein